MSLRVHKELPEELSPGRGKCRHVRCAEPTFMKEVLTMAMLKTVSYAIARRTKMTAVAGFYKY